MSCHVMSCHVMSCHVMSSRLITCHHMSYQQLSATVYETSPCRSWPRYASAVSWQTSSPNGISSPLIISFSPQSLPKRCVASKHSVLRIPRCLILQFVARYTSWQHPFESNNFPARSQCSQHHHSSTLLHLNNLLVIKSIMLNWKETT